MLSITQLIETCWIHRQRVWPPDADTALMWALTEMGEATELLLERKADWVRNNPGKHPPFSKDRLAEELGDIIMMVVIAGMVEDVNPIVALRNKLKSHIIGDS